MHFMVFAVFVLHVLLFDQVFAQPRKPATISEISTYMGADREQLLYAGAKSEGVSNWFDSTVQFTNARRIPQ